MSEPPAKKRSQRTDPAPGSASGKPAASKRAASAASSKKGAQAAAPQGNALAALIEGLPDAVFAKDLQGRYLLINEAGARFLGRTVDEILGKTDGELFPPEVAAATIARDRQVFAAGHTLTYEEVDRTPAR
jgi:PAS domain-containing protein